MTVIKVSNENETQFLESTSSISQVQEQEKEKSRERSPSDKGLRNTVVDAAESLVRKAKNMLEDSFCCCGCFHWVSSSRRVVAAKTFKLAAVKFKSRRHFLRAAQCYEKAANCYANLCSESGDSNMLQCLRQCALCFSFVDFSETQRVFERVLQYHAQREDIDQFLDAVDDALECVSAVESVPLKSGDTLMEDLDAFHEYSHKVELFLAFVSLWENRLDLDNAKNAHNVSGAEKYLLTVEKEFAPINGQLVESFKQLAIECVEVCDLHSAGTLLSALCKKLMTAFNKRLTVDFDSGADVNAAEVVNTQLCHKHVDFEQVPEELVVSLTQLVLVKFAASQNLDSYQNCVRKALSGEHIDACIGEMTEDMQVFLTLKRLLQSAPLFDAVFELSNSLMEADTDRTESELVEAMRGEMNKLPKMLSSDKRLIKYTLVGLI